MLPNTVFPEFLTCTLKINTPPPPKEKGNGRCNRQRSLAMVWTLSISGYSRHKIHFGRTWNSWFWKHKIIIDHCNSITYIVWHSAGIEKIQNWITWNKQQASPVMGLQINHRVHGYIIVDKELIDDKELIGDPLLILTTIILHVYFRRSW